MSINRSIASPRLILTAQGTIRPLADRPFDPEAFLEAADKPTLSPLLAVAGIVLGVIALFVVWRLASSLLAPASPPVAVLRTTTPTGAVALVVATPEPVLMETDRPVPVTTVTAPAFVVITNTPTAASVRELLERTIAEATRTVTAGPPTAIPLGVVTATSAPTSTPYPLNTETAQAQIIMITVEALTTGTWTPAPALAQAEPPPSATPSVTPAASFTPYVDADRYADGGSNAAATAADGNAAVAVWDYAGSDHPRGGCACGRRAGAIRQRAPGARHCVSGHCSRVGR